MTIEKMSIGSLKNLISVFPEKRKTGFSEIQKTMVKINVDQYKKLCYGIFYYFWWSDGFENQEKDIQAIINLSAGLDESGKLNFVKYFFQVFTKLWNKIDYHRINKFLKLIKEVFFDFYKYLRDRERSNISKWNSFIITEIFSNPYAKGILLEYLYICRDLFSIFLPDNIFKFFLFFKPLLDLLAFHEDSSVRKFLLDDTIPFMLEKINAFGKSDLLVFKKYIVNYIDNKEVCQKFATNFLEIEEFLIFQIRTKKTIKNEICEKVEKNGTQETAQKVEKNGTQETTQKVEKIDIPSKIEKKEKTDIPSKIEKKEKTIVKEPVEKEKEKEKNLKVNEDIQLEEIKEEASPEDIMDMEEDFEEEEYIYLDSDNFDDRQLMMDEFGNVIEDLEDEDFYDPYENLSEDEMRAKMPPYWFKTGKKKKRFFQNLSRTYKEKLYNIAKNITPNDRKKIIFKLERNQIRTFKKSKKLL
jgi:hypothetical protein